nr:Chain 62, Chlorophyll a-b binding protein 1B-21, chloroplastic [Porphyridium purpureum]7Y5E_6N Chain 6N, Chlorophyll a-b binding protein 1B-21, chloroplastic [Porphyridium purpureum]7Y7A_67 Chain 67, Chlorophyll a-b binding protein 1B-21, chloroplastic [Porphyridium purpureum]7Y7A_6o Chain 6o, Chlorophyll a-b binding protein 1B-21, chloroplastic [Porphyridium purpureum]
FMEAPAALDGSMVGDVGFDPLGFSNYIDLKFLREAELKHCRICMLAALGIIVQEVYQFPFYSGAPRLATDAHDYFVKFGSLNQILLFASFIELVAGTPGIIQTMRGETDRAPGYFAFDPLGLGKDKAKFERYQLSELKNGRLAMIAVGGFIHQAWMAKVPVLEQLSTGK